MKEFWNARYAEDDFAYGCEPNVFLKEKISKIGKGKILFSAEGEGRNAVFAAQEVMKLMLLIRVKKVKKKPFNWLKTVKRLLITK